MHAMFTWRLAGFWATGLALTLLAACGGPSGAARESPSSPASQVASAPSPVMPQPRSPATKEQLKKIVLQASDLPVGWQAGPYLGLPNEAGVNAVMADCMGIRNTAPDMVTETKSAQYINGAVQVQSVAAGYRSERDLDEDFGALRNPRLSPCYELLYRKLLQALGVTVRSLSIKATPAPAGSPANVVGVVTMTITDTQGGIRRVEHDRFVFIRGPLVEAQVEMTSNDTPIPEGLLSLLVAKVASRAARP